MDKTKIVLRQTHIKVKLFGEDGSPTHILKKVSQALRRGGYNKNFIDAYLAEAQNGDYNHLIATTAKVVEVQ